MDYGDESGKMVATSRICFTSGGGDGGRGLNHYAEVFVLNILLSTQCYYDYVVGVLKFFVNVSWGSPRILNHNIVIMNK